MEPGELVLSDVHVDTNYDKLGCGRRVVSRFYFNLPPDCGASQAADKSLTSQAIGTTNLNQSEAFGDGDRKLGVYDTNSYLTTAKFEGEAASKSIETGEKNDIDDGSSNIGSIDKDIDATKLETCDIVERKRPEFLLDEDGDLAVKRKPRNIAWSHVITLEHSLATELQDVGQQVWQGALLLCDFIIHNSSHFLNKVVLDLGAGTGLTSIVAGMFARTGFCTDIGEVILHQAQQNIHLNSDLIGGDGIYVRELDWFMDDRYPDTDSEFQFKSHELEKTQIIIAADVVYDDMITDAFFRTVHRLMSRKSMTLYIALERRYIFTVSKLDINSPAYDHFVTCLDQLTWLSEEHGVQYAYNKLDIDFAQYFKYKRLKQLELYEVISSFPDN